MLLSVTNLFHIEYSYWMITWFWLYIVSISSMSLFLVITSCSWRVTPLFIQYPFDMILRAISPFYWYSASNLIAPANWFLLIILKLHCQNYCLCLHMMVLATSLIPSISHLSSFLEHVIWQILVCLFQPISS